MGRAPVVTILASLVLAACAVESTDAPAVTVRDSAGIRIVTNHVSPDAVPVYGELGQADLEIGVVDGDPAYAFTNILDVQTLPGGGIVVVEGGAQELRLFDQDGDHVRTVGRMGEGPGEFSRLAPLAGLAGDSIWTWDSRLSRLTWFSTDGDALGEMRIRVGDLLVAELSRLADGTHLAAVIDFSAADGVDDYYVAPQPLYKLDASGQPLDSLRDVGGTDMFVSRGTSSSGRTMVTIGPVPLGRDSFYATGRERLYTGWNDRYRIIARSLAGDPVLVVLAPGLERSIESEEVDALRARRLAQCTDDPCKRDVNTILDDVRFPERRPAFSALEVDALQNLWVAEYEPARGPPTGWHVFSADGTLLGRVEVPEGLEVHEIGADYVLGEQRDALGVPFVHRLPLTRMH